MPRPFFFFFFVGTLYYTHLTGSGLCMGAPWIYWVMEQSGVALFIVSCQIRASRRDRNVFKDSDRRSLAHR